MKIANNIEEVVNKKTQLIFELNENTNKFKT